MPLQLDRPVLGRELPIDRPAEGITLRVPRRHLAFERLPVRDASVQALAAEDTQLELNEPMLLHVL